ncbi:hypothetical protein YC2023_065188 [Brassica napus]
MKKNKSPKKNPNAGASDAAEATASRKLKPTMAMLKKPPPPDTQSRRRSELQRLIVYETLKRPRVSEFTDLTRERFSEYHEIVKKVKKDPTFEKTTDHAVMGIRRHVAVPPGTTLNTVTPCAACKLLRRRCAEECPFSPYFSPHEPHKFAAVHKVFGASNVSKMLLIITQACTSLDLNLGYDITATLEQATKLHILEVGESQRGDAANSLVYEANLRLRDPIYGCMGAISALQHHIQSLQSELTTVRTEILRHKYREAATITSLQNNNNNNFNNTTTSVSDHAALAASILLPPPPPPPPPPRPPRLLSSQPAPPPTPPASLPSPSMVVSSSSSNSSATNSIYNPPPSSTAGYSNSLSSDNNPTDRPSPGHSNEPKAIAHIRVASGVRTRVRRIGFRLLC